MAKYVLDNSVKTTIGTVIVCANYPQLRKLYERANEFGLYNLAERIANTCKRLEAE